MQGHATNVYKGDIVSVNRGIQLWQYSVDWLLSTAIMPGDKTKLRQAVASQVGRGRARANYQLRAM